MNTSRGHRRCFLLNQLDIAVLIAVNCLICSSFPGAIAFSLALQTLRGMCVYGKLPQDCGRMLEESYLGQEALSFTLQIL